MGLNSFIINVVVVSVQVHVIQLAWLHMVSYLSVYHF